MLYVSVAAIRLFDRLRQARVGHAVKNVAHRLRMISFDLAQNLRVKLINCCARSTLPFYGAGTINSFDHRAFRALRDFGFAFPRFVMGALIDALRGVASC